MPKKDFGRNLELSNLWRGPYFEPASSAGITLGISLASPPSLAVDLCGGGSRRTALNNHCLRAVVSMLDSQS